MSAVLFDYTRFLTALQRTSPNEAFRPHLFMWDLAKLVESIVIFDKVHTTEGIRRDFSRWKKDKQGLFDFSCSHYDVIFNEIFEEDAGAVLTKEQKALHEDLMHNRRQYGRIRAYVPDIDLLPEIRDKVRLADFQYLGGYANSANDEGILMSMERTRMLLDLSSAMGAPYDPVAFREPIVRQIAPANVGTGGLRHYRQFERELGSYLTGMVERDSVLGLPLIFEIVLRDSRSGSPDDIFRVALEIRNHPKVKLLRSRLDELDQARLEGDISLVARADRVVKDEIEKFKKSVSGKMDWPIDVELKLGMIPIELSLSLTDLLQRFRDRSIRPAFAHLRKLSRETLLPLADVAAESERVMGISLSAEDLPPK